MGNPWFPDGPLPCSQRLLNALGLPPGKARSGRDEDDPAGDEQADHALLRTSSMRTSTAATVRPVKRSTSYATRDHGGGDLGQVEAVLDDDVQVEAEAVGVRRDADPLRQLVPVSSRLSPFADMPTTP